MELTLLELAFDFFIRNQSMIISMSMASIALIVLFLRRNRNDSL